jgi:hypothetical protein
MFSNQQGVPWVNCMFGAFFSKRSTSLGPMGPAPLFTRFKDSRWELLTSGFEPMNWTRGGTRYNAVACKAKEIHLQNVSSVWDSTISQNYCWRLTTPCHLVCTFLTCQRNVVPSASKSGSPQRESGTTQPMTHHHIPEESDIPHPAWSVSNYCILQNMKCTNILQGEIGEEKYVIDSCSTCRT